MPFNPVANATFLDAFGANQFTASQYNALLAGSQAPLVELFRVGTKPVTIDVADVGTRITVGLMLERAAPQSQVDDLLAGNWAQRQAALAAFATPEALWATYGANPATYASTVAQVNALLGGGAPAPSNYVSSAADRTIWLSLDPGQFATLFGQQLLQVSSGSNSTLAWTGTLQLNDQITAGVIGGIWVEKSVTIANPAVLVGTPVSLSPGPLGIANDSADQVTAPPAAIAANYRFPLPPGVATNPVALVEPDVPDQAALFTAFNQYRQQVGLAAVTPGQFRIVSGTDVSGTVSDELALDISVVAGAVPNSNLLLYSMGSGTFFNAYQQAFFDRTNAPAVISSSFGSINNISTAQSPFYWAVQQLMVDGVLANVSVHRSGGDSGSGGAVANGGVNLSNDHSMSYQMLVGGTSISSLSSALTDPTVAALVALALQDDPGTVFSLVAGGLKTLPSHLSAAAPGPAGAATALTAFVETVWQALSVQTDRDRPSVLEVAYGAHETGGGAIASQTAIPSYQSAFGLGAMTGGLRGAPDVAALAGGNGHYAVLNGAYVSDPNQPLLRANGGTSAASPLWASLTTQFNTIFGDQGLPELGFYNDLLYIAAAVAPGSFNDIRLGSNITSFYASDGLTGYFNPATNQDIVPTGVGFSAQPGYDLVSGLGSPNGLLLARALTAIAHQQVSFGNSPAMLDSDGTGGWVAGAAESLMVQTFSPDGDATVGLHVGNGTTALASGATASFAWTARLAQQSLQADFDPALVLLFDKQAQGAVGYANVAAGQSIGVDIDGRAGQATQASLSNPFGFVDFFAGGDAVHVARAVSVAQTVGGANDALAVVRIRQGGENNLQLTFYEVDDLSGTIDGRAPGHGDYAALAQGRAYQTTSGATGITGAGYGQFNQVLLTGVDAGDIIAMRLDNLTTGAFFWAFANANETVNGRPAVHMINQGLNTYGWEDTYGLGDRDYNDMTVQLDFTSAHGQGWLV
jgi:hypothetical protein